MVKLTSKIRGFTFNGLWIDPKCLIALPALWALIRESDNVCIITAREKDANKKEHLHTLSIKIFKHIISVWISYRDPNVVSMWCIHGGLNVWAFLPLFWLSVPCTWFTHKSKTHFQRPLSGCFTTDELHSAVPLLRIFKPPQERGFCGIRGIKIQTVSEAFNNNKQMVGGVLSSHFFPETLLNKGKSIC